MTSEERDLVSSLADAVAFLLTGLAVSAKAQSQGGNSAEFDHIVHMAARIAAAQSAVCGGPSTLVASDVDAARERIMSTVDGCLAGVK